MSLLAAKMTVTHKVTWSPASGDTVTFNGLETFTQLGTAAQAKTQNIASTTTTLDLGDATGDKYFGVKNTEDPKGTTSKYIFIDKVTPVVPADAPFKLAPGKAMLISTNVDVWYAIVGDKDGVLAGVAEAFVCAVEP
jgi:hypothetical protein